MTTNETLRQRADTLLAAMTFEEKAGQLSQYFYLAGMQPQTTFVEAEVRAGRAGSILFVAKPDETNRLQRIAVEESRLGIPLLFGFDVIHGLRTIFPVPLGLAASWDPGLYERVQATAARRWPRPRCVAFRGRRLAPTSTSWQAPSTSSATARRSAGATMTR